MNSLKSSWWACLAAVVTNEQITDLENLTLGQERDNVKQWHWKSPINVDISLFWNQIIASVNQYSATDVASLKTKLAQFPSGTKFLVNISGSPPSLTTTGV